MSNDIRIDIEAYQRKHGKPVGRASGLSASSRGP
jgi:hypothetical protein